MAERKSPCPLKSTVGFRDTLMNQIKAEKYRPQNDFLKSFIKYFWVIKTNNVNHLSYKLLPVNNIDIVLNFASPMNYLTGGKIVTAPEYSFTGIRNRYQMVDQAGKLNIFGVSFFPAGFYPFLKRPLSEYSDQTVDFSIWNKNFRSIIEKKFEPEGIILQQIEVLEDLFLQFIDPQSIPENRIFKLINLFFKNILTLTIKEFCEKYGINQRRLERIFGKYIGVSPKSYQRINRFQFALNRLLRSDMNDFTTIAHETFYYDQAHFIHDFNFFTGCSPSHFLSEKRSMKQILTN